MCININMHIQKWIKNISEGEYDILIELSMRQQFAGLLGSSAAMQMPALHFPLGRYGRALGGGKRGLAYRMFRCRRRKLRALHKSSSDKPNLICTKPDIDTKQILARYFNLLFSTSFSYIFWRSKDNFNSEIHVHFL